MGVWNPGTAVRSTPSTRKHSSRAKNCGSFFCGFWWLVCGRRERGLFFRARVERSEHGLDLLIARGDELLVLFPQRVTLAQGEEVLLPPVAPQAFGDDFARGFDAMVLQTGQRHRIAFPREDRFEDGQARDAGEVADDVLELDVHLRERLVQMVHALGRALHQALAVAQDGTHRADFIGRTKARAQEPDRVEILQPLAILHIGLAAGQVFAMARIDEHHFQSGGFEDLEERDPINAGRFQRDGIDATRLEPVAHGEQVLGEGLEAAHRTRVGAGRHRDVDFPRADVDAGGVRMERGERGRFVFGFSRIAFRARGHNFPFADEAPTPHLRPVGGREGNGDGVVVDIQADVDNNFHVSAFLSGLSLTTNHGGSAHRLTSGRNPRSRKADTLTSPIASHSD